MTERKTPEEKFAHRVFRQLDIIQLAASEKAEMIRDANPGASEAFKSALAEALSGLMQHISHPDTDLDAVDIHGWPWPKPEDYQH